MHGQTYGCRFCIRAMLLATLTALVFSVGLSTRTASAATYQYCGGCVIYAGQARIAPNAYFITNSYAHRLSGPAGTQIGSAALYTDNWTWSTWAMSTSTQVNRLFNGTRPAQGAARHWGGGNYGFNAHVGY